MKIQRQLSNGSWLNENRIDLIEDAAEKYNTTPSEIIEQLQTGKEINFGSDWYSNIRVTPEPIKILEPILVNCDCGHNVPQIQVMNTSLGTSCPYCYDRMS